MVDHVKSDQDDPAGAASARGEPTMRSKAAKAVSLGKRRLKHSAITGLRSIVPLVEAYTGTRASEQPEGSLPGTLGLQRGQNAVLKAGTSKMFLEMVEIASRTHPVFPDATPFKARDEQGVAQTPHLMHLLALVAFARASLVPDPCGDDKTPPDSGDGGGGAGATVSIAPEQTVLFMPVAPGEYALRSGPMAPAEIRRMAMRQRSYTPPQAARLLSAPNAPRTVVGPAGGGTSAPGTAAPRMQQQAMKGQPQQMNKQAAQTAQTAVAVASRSSGCGCGRASSQGCARCGGGRRGFSPARYDEDGSCASVLDISCDTRWRVRESFKLALCDLLRCVGDQVCDEDGQFVDDPDLGACLETFVCSLLQMLPDAICAPPVKCCPAPEQDGCGSGDDCNFAVGD
jgi:hypothetical protein